MICDTLAHLGRYKGLHKNLDTAIDYLLSHDLSQLPLGRTEVEGEEVFINVMEAQLKPAEDSCPEYHRRYADLQLDLTGGEGWFACGGKAIPITWGSDSADSPLWFQTADGEPLVLGRGNSYIAITQTGSAITGIDL